jgi:hypothetical protein
MAEIIKGTNFRLNQEDADQFRLFCESMGWNQAQGFTHLMHLLEMDVAKEVIPERKTEISDFEAHANALVAAFLHSLELNQNAEERIRMEFAQEIERNKTLLDEKIEQIKELKVQLVDLTGASEQAKQLQKELDAAVDQARHDRLDFEERLADKSRALKDADARVAMLEIKADGYDELKAERDSLDKRLQKAVQDKKDLERDHAAAMERAAREAEKTQEAAVAAVKAAGDAQVEALKNELRDAEIAGARALQAAEKLAHDADLVSAAEIRRLEQVNAKLQMELLELRAKLPKEE